jgi:hypothetical protein
MTSGSRCKVIVKDGASDIIGVLVLVDGEPWLTWEYRLIENDVINIPAMSNGIKE